MSRWHRIRRAGFWLIILPIGVCCVLGLWNASGHRLAFGQRLEGDEPPPHAAWSLPAVANHLYQKGVQDAASRKLPFRPLLVRLNNQVLYSLLDVSPTGNILLGRNDNLVEKGYVEKYCQQLTTKTWTEMRASVARLKALQDYFTARHRAFVYVISPSKVARMPEQFADQLACPIDPSDQNPLSGAYLQLLQNTGIHFVDAATLMTKLRQKGITPFAPGGVHWTMQAAAYAANDVIAKLNAGSASPILPPLTWTTSPSNHPLLEDDDMFRMLNLLSRNWPHPSVAVSFKPADVCPRGEITMTAVGGSFTNQITRALADTGCIGRGLYFFYLDQSLRKFAPAERRAQPHLPLDAIKPMIDADVVVVEENEISAGRSAHVRRFADLMLGKDASSAGPAPVLQDTGD